ncbi:MAG: 3'-5' exonuclease [Aeromonas veronii]
MSLSEMCAAHGLSVKEFLAESGLPETTVYRWATSKTNVLTMLMESAAIRLNKRPAPIPPIVPQFLNSPKATPFIAVLDVETLAQSVHAVIGTIGVTVVNVMTGQEIGHFYTRIDLNLPQSARVMDQDTLAFWERQKTENPAAWAELFDRSLPRGSLRRALESLAEFLNFMEAGGREIEIVGNGPEFDNAIICDACKQLDLHELWHFRRNQSMRTGVWMGRLLLGVDPKYQIPFEGVQHHAGDDSRHEAKTIVSIVRSFVTGLMFPSLPPSGWPHPPVGKDRSLELTGNWDGEAGK